MPQIHMVWGGLQIPAASTLNKTGSAADRRQLTAAAAHAAIPLVYGEDWVGALVLNILPAGTTVVIQCLWCLACDSIQEVLFNGAPLPAAATVTHYTGSQSTPDATVVAAMAAQGISYADALNGLAYSVLVIPQAAFAEQLQITARVRGRAVYDPRSGGTAWSDNPALALADFEASAAYGCGQTVDWTSVATAANACDEALAGGERRRVMGVAFINPAPVADVVETLRAYAGCFVIPGAAGIRLLPDADGAAVATYDHSAGQIAALGALEKRDLGNVPTVVEVIYTDRSKAPWRDAVASAQLPGVGTTLPRRVSQVRLPGVQRYSQAQREATERLNKLTLGDMSTTLEVFDLGIRHEVGDLIAVTHPVGLSAKPFRVAGPPQLLRAGEWRLALTEHDPAAYSNTVATAPSVPDTTLRNPAGPPAAAASLTLTAEDYGIRARWPASPESDVFDYELRRGASWGAGLPLVGSQPTVVGSTDYLWPAQPVGSYTLRLKPLDNEGLQAAADVAATITITAPAITGLAATLAGAAMRLVWAGVKASFAIATYRVSWGAAAGANPVGDYSLAAFDRVVNWAGARTWWVQAIDVGGNLGPAQSIEVVITAPGAPTAPRVEVIDNNVLIFCSPPATGSLPVREYEVRKGASWAAGSVVGSNGNSTFFSLFEQAAGDYTYWIAARDTAGNLGAAAQVTAKVSQPPDYILRTNLDSTFGGTLTGCYLEGGRLIGPAFTAESAAQHFDARGWSAPQQQVDAGYPLYIQPAAASGTYVEDIDYGTLIPASTIAVTPTFAVVSGAPTLSVQIQYKAAAGDAWTSAAAGAASVLASAFRYVRVTLTLTANGATGLIEVAGLNIKFAMKRRNDGGTYTITDANAGVWVPFGYAFIDADLPQCQPAGGSPLLAVIDFVDAPNPSGFRVYHYTIAGAKTTGTGSWAASGY